MSGVVVEHHGGHSGGHSGGGGPKFPTPVLIGGAVVLVLLLVLLTKGKGGGAGSTVVAGGQPTDAAYAAWGNAYTSQQQAAASQRSDALRGAVQMVQLDRDYELASGELSLKNSATMYGLKTQRIQVEGALVNDRADIDSRERVSLTQISSRERVDMSSIAAQRDLGMYQVDGQVKIGLAQTDMQRQIGMAKIDADKTIGLKQIDSVDKFNDQNFALGKLKITTDDKFRNRALDKEYDFKFWDSGKSWDFQNSQLIAGTQLANKHLDNEFSLGNRDRDNTRYQLGTERQGTWFNGIGNLLGPVGQFLKLFGL